VNDADLGTRGTAGFAEVLEAHGLLGTFFVIPGDIESNVALYRSLGDRGHEVGGNPRGQPADR
jgi:peptidoglycan/xylan/chitin deacetylase (PgdA/CDA1 family)